MSVFAPPHIRVRIKGYKDSKSRGQMQISFALGWGKVVKCRLFKDFKVGRRHSVVGYKVARQANARRFKVGQGCFSLRSLKSLTTLKTLKSLRSLKPSLLTPPLKKTPLPRPLPQKGRETVGVPIISRQPPRCGRKRLPSCSRVERVSADPVSLLQS